MATITLDTQTVTAFTITLASLANGSARQSTLLSNTSDYPAALIFIKLTSAGTPTLNNVSEIYLIRGDNPSSSTYRTDGAGGSDAALTVLNAQLIGTIKHTATASEVSYGDFDTAPLGPLGPEWGIAIKNSSGANYSATAGNFVASYAYYVPTIV